MADFNIDERVNLDNLRIPPRAIDNCTVVSIPAGEFPKTIEVTLPGEEGQRVLVRAQGTLPDIAVNDTVRIWLDGTKMEGWISGESPAGATGAKPSKLYTPDGATESLTIDANGDAKTVTGSPALGNIYGNAFLPKLSDETEGQLFNDNDSSYPDGWTETDAALATNTNDKSGFWYLEGGSAETSYDYRKQSGVNIESLASDFWASFLYGPIMFRDGDFSGDLNYRFAVHADSSGIDLDTFVRVCLHWDSAGNQWQVRGESKDGSTQTNGAYSTFSFPITQPVYFRCVVRNHTTPASRIVRSYIGTTPEAKTHTLLQQNLFSATWGAVFLRIDQDRGTGGSDYLYIGMADYLGDNA